VTYPVVDFAYGSYEYLMREVGAVLGYGRNADTWSHEQRGTANAVVQRGVRDFYSPVPLEGEKYAHQWSFLSPVRQLTTVSGTYKYTLPADFAMLDGPITFEPDQSVLYEPIRVVSDYEVRRRQQESDYTGRPTLAALVPSELPGRTELHFWTTPDDEYVLEYRCQVSPVDLSETNPMPYGGKTHAAAIIESCLKTAVDEKHVRGGTHGEQYKQRLAASVSHDRKVMCPRTLGRGVMSDGRDHGFYSRELDVDVTTYDGVEWD